METITIKTETCVKCEGSGNPLGVVEGGLAAKLDHGPGAGPVHSLAQHPSEAQLVTAARGVITVWQDREPEPEVEEECSSSASVYDAKPHWM